MPRRTSDRAWAGQFRDPDLPRHVERVLQATGLASDRLELEMTEGLLMEDNEASVEILGRIERLGVGLAIDDCGTGYSSLAYLKRFQVDTLKLDRSFVRGLPLDRESPAIAGAVRALAGSLGLSVVYEGVESEAQRDLLREMGCDLMQGYLLARPMPASELMGWWGAREDASAGRRTAPAPLDSALRAPIRLASSRS
jgi:EAL domain-containing protein (putative c-di-GMP-specific phosphodiesterase class I)